VHVLAQVRFSPVFSIDKAVPTIQESLKPLGFVRAAKRSIQHITIQEAKPPQVEAVERWEFLDAKKTVAVLLTRDFVALQTNRYSTFEQFSDQLGRIVEVVKRIAGVEFAERLGLRYVDLVRPGDKETASDYLVCGLTGYPFRNVEEIEPSTISFSSQSTAVTTAGVLSVRCHQAVGQILPADLVPLALDYSWTVPPSETVTILDFDHYSEKTRPFEVAALVETMWQLHDLIGIVFQNAVTDLALQRWGLEKK